MVGMIEEQSRLLISMYLEVANKTNCPYPRPDLVETWFFDWGRRGSKCLNRQSARIEDRGSDL